MVIYSVIADFFFFWVVRSPLNRQALPLATRMQSKQDVVEELVQLYLALVPAFRGSQVRSDMFIELFFGYTGRNPVPNELGRYSAHSCGSFVRGCRNYDALSSS